jgi:hypothetical protein
MLIIFLNFTKTFKFSKDEHTYYFIDIDYQNDTKFTK